MRRSKDTPALREAFFEQAEEKPISLSDVLERLLADVERSREVMSSTEAADFLRVSEAQFKRMAPYLPRHPITERRYVYIRSELLAWLKER